MEIKTAAAQNTSSANGKVARFINLELDGIKIGVALWDNSKDAVSKKLATADLETIRALLVGEKFEVVSVNDATPTAPKGSLAEKLANL